MIACIRGKSDKALDCLCGGESKREEDRLSMVHLSLNEFWTFL